jgi:hypothetical protein
MLKIITILLLTQISIASASEITLDSVPPVIVKTSPQAGDSSVDPSQSEVRAIFSKDMMTNQMWSVMMIDGGIFPKITGEIKYLNDKRTFVMPVKLLPNKTYAMRFNSNKQNAFRDASGKPAESYLLVFKTR